MKLSKEQQNIISELYFFFQNNRYKSVISSYKTLGGYAGTGKTFLISEFKKYLDEKEEKCCVAFVTPTGKAASVLKRKLENLNCFNINNNFCGTIHSFMYYPKIDEKTMLIKGWYKKGKNEIGPYRLIIIDEASMVDREIFNDLRSYNIPIIAVGDHGQLYPVSSKNNFSLMKNPDFVLTEIYRQDKGNAIIDISMEARKTGDIKNGYYSNCVFKTNPNDKVARHVMENTDFLNSNIVMLTNSNRERMLMNEYVRITNKFNKDIIYPGEKVVCLTNNYNYGCMNGEIYNVMWITSYDKNLYEMVVKKEGEESLTSILTLKKSFGQESYENLYSEIYKLKQYYFKKKKDHPEVVKNGFALFDFGYAMSVHKAQGSSWEKIILFERRNKYQDDDSWKRWLYTGITRAERSLLIINGQYFTD